MLSQANSKYLLEETYSEFCSCKSGETIVPSSESKNNAYFSNGLWSIVSIDKDSLLSHAIPSTPTNISSAVSANTFRDNGIEIIGLPRRFTRY